MEQKKKNDHMKKERNKMKTAEKNILCMSRDVNEKMKYTNIIICTCIR